MNTTMDNTKITTTQTSISFSGKMKDVSNTINTLIEQYGASYKVIDLVNIINKK